MAEPDKSAKEVFLLQEKEEDVTFDELLAIVGNNGRFQFIFNWLFNFIYGVLLSMAFMNYVLVISTPDHWCHVPRSYVNDTKYENLTVEEWRNFTIPMMKSLTGIEMPSHCEMYKDPLDPSPNDTQKCQFGWEYNKTWWESTVTSDEDWVCDRATISIDTMVSQRVGDLIGTIILGVLGDMLGRRPVFYVTVFSMFIGRVLLLWTTSSYWLVMLVTAFGAATINSGFQSPLTIAMEISDAKARASIASYQFLGWTVGLSILPLIYWVCRTWKSFILITTVPGIFIVFFARFMIESPRWLMSQGRVDDAYKQLEVIASVNRKPIPTNFYAKLNKLSLSKEPTFSMLGLFKTWRLAKNTLLLCLCWTSGMLCYQILLFNVENLAGNPHLNFFFQALIEFPSNLVGKLACDRYGRRMSMLLGNLLAIVMVIIIVVYYPYMANSPILTLILMNIYKFFISFAFYVLNLQSLEVYPTCARASGTSVSFFCAMGLSVFAPVIAKQGQFDGRVPIIYMGLLVGLSGIFGTFLPETKNVSLPESFEEAKTFGADQSYWNFWQTPTKKTKKSTKDDRS